jgi:alkyl hydroperoxide reductase subunit AhpC
MQTIIKNNSNPIAQIYNPHFTSHKTTKLLTQIRSFFIANSQNKLVTKILNQKKLPRNCDKIYTTIKNVTKL